jgi:signal transduction histidine kinase
MNSAIPVRRLLSLCCALRLVGVAAGEEPLETVQEARALPPAVASEGRPVRLHGVISYLRRTEKDYNFSLHDATGGVMVYPAGRPELQPGQEVTVTGQTTVALHGLQISKATVVPGAVRGLPEPRPATVSEVLEGKYEEDFVQVEAVVRGVRLEDPSVYPQRLAVDLGSRRQRLTLWIIRYDPANIGFAAGDTVKVRGVVVRWTNTRGQPQSTSLLTNSVDDVQTLKRATEPATVPVRELLLWTGSATFAERTRTDGTVTFQQGVLAVVQDGESAIRVFRTEPGALQEKPAERLRAGDRVEVLGFPALGEYTAELEDASWHRLGTGARVAPLAFANGDAVVSKTALVDRDARLITLPGTLRGISTRDDRRLLEMESGRTVFHAWLPADAVLPEAVRPGSELQLEGICTLHLSDTLRRLGRRPDEFSLELIGAGSVRVLRPAPWWNAARLGWALGAAGAAALLLALWAGSLRGRNRRLREEMAARAEAERKLAHERERVAGELHDTLQQTLTATALQLNAATRTLEAQPAMAGERLALAQQLVERSRLEVREAVWDLRVGEASAEPLPVLLERVCAECSSGQTAEVSFTQEGEERPPSALVASQVLRLVREAIANALKHAAPRHVRVHLRTGERQLYCSVSDDGCGFDMGHAPGPETGHFGVTGMEERVGRLGGTMCLTSTPGIGTSIEFRLPLHDA